MSTERTTIHRRLTETGRGRPTDRRHFLGAAGAAVAAGAFAGLGAGSTAEASDGDNFLIGGDNTATNTTLLNGGTTLYVEDGGSTDNATVSVHQTHDEAIALHAEATGATGSVAINAYNASANGSAVAAVNSGSGGRALRADNLDVGAEAILAINTVDDAIAVNAINAAFGGTAVNAASGEDGTGLSASSTNGRAIYAQAGGSTETMLVTSGMSAAVVAEGDTFDFVAHGSGKVLLDGTGVSNPPGNVAAGGVLTRDGSNNVWASVAANQWRKLAGPAAAGAFHPITPVRLYDSRPSKGGGGPIAAGEFHTLSVGITAPGGPQIVAVGAQAMSYTLTVTNTVGSNGFLAVTEGDTTGYTASTINWTAPGTTIANSTVVKVDGELKIRVYCGGPAGVQTNYIVDVLGYYR